FPRPRRGPPRHPVARPGRSSAPAAGERVQTGAWARGHPGRARAWHRDSPGHSVTRSVEHSHVTHVHSHPPAFSAQPHPDHAPPCDSPGLRAGHLARARDTPRVPAATVLPCLIAVVEAIGGWLTGSLALLSDAGHMWTDVSALGLALLAAWFAGRPANRKRTYGYVRLEILSALVNGVLLLAVTVFIVIEALARLKHPTPIALVPMALVSTIGLGANLLAMGFLHSGPSLNTRSAFL